MDTVAIPGFPDYTITSTGKIFKNNKPKKVSCKKGRSAKVIIRVQKKMYTFGLATLIAEAFIPHPRHHTHIIFKDRNHHHCTKDNIAWVDAETYFYYCCPGKRGRPRLIIDRQEAITTCTSEELKRYYLTLDPYWIGEAWKNVEARMSPYSFWHDLRSDCYLYYIDRVKRFSILSDPNKVIWFYVKRALIQLKKEISPDLLYRKLRETDESLRKTIFKD